MRTELMRFLGGLLPQFRSEWVGFRCDEAGHAYPVYPMAIWERDDDGIPDLVCWVRSFSLLGVSLFGRVVGEPISYHAWELLALEGRADDD
ncbi:MAG: hypothetical protein ACOC0M_00180 [Halomonas sp.]